MEKQNLIEFVQKHGTDKDKADLQKISDFQLRSVAQRLQSECRVNLQRDQEMLRFKITKR